MTEMNSLNTFSERFVDELLQGYTDAGDYVKNSLGDLFLLSISQQSSEYLISTMSALCRFMIYLQTIGNRCAADALKAKRVLESQKYKAMAKTKESNPKETNQARLAKAYELDPTLSESEARLAELEEKSRFYERLPDRVHEYIQVIKMELRRRESVRSTNVKI